MIRKILTVIFIFFFLSSSIYPITSYASDAGWESSGQATGGGTQTGGEGPQEQTDANQQQEPSHGSCSAADPVYLHSGEFYYECQDLHIPGRGMDVTVKHLYQSGTNHNAQFGYGWTMNYYERLRTLDTGAVQLISGNFRRDEYVWDEINEQYISPSGFFDALTENVDGTWTRTTAHGMKHHYDINGALSSIEDRNGNTIQFQYDQAGLLPIIGISPYSQNPDERIVIGYDYRLTQIIDTAGRTVDFTYDADGRLDFITDYAGRTVDYTYDTVTDDLTVFTKPATPQYPSGVTKTFTYNTDHHVVSIADGRGQTFVTNRYDAQGRVEEQDYGSGTWQFDYGVTNQTTITDRKGHETTIQFNAAGNPVQREVFTQGLRPYDPDPASYITQTDFNDDGLRTAVIYPKGNGVKYIYDEMNADTLARKNLIEIRRKTDMAAEDNDDEDIVIRITYESQFNFPKTVTDANGNVYTYLYDYELAPTDQRYGTHGNIVRIQMPTITVGQNGSPVVLYRYNNYGQVTEISDPNNLLTGFEYDEGTGYLSEIVRNQGGINAATRLAWDVYGNIDTITDAENRLTDVDIDAMGWIRQVTDPLGYVTKYFQDENGNLTRVERQANDSAGVWQTTQFTYDVLNNLTSITDPLNRLTSLTYDLNENLESVIDANGNVTSYSFDERDLIYTLTDANTPQGVTRYDYDINGNLKRVSDAGSNETLYAYDLFDRLNIMTYADGRTREYGYDDNSNILRVKTPGSDPDVYNLTYEYDELNRLSAIRHPQAAQFDKTYLYDLASRLRFAETPAVKNTFIYDDLNRVIQNIQTHSSDNQIRRLTYQYDKTDNLTLIYYPSGTTINYEYDGRNQMTAAKLNGELIADYDYDALMRRTQLNYGNNSRQEYSYDIANQLTQINHVINQAPAVFGVTKSFNKMFKALNLFSAVPAEALGEIAVPVGTFAYFNYNYDQVGNRTMMRTFDDVQQYGYNGIYELVSVNRGQSTVDSFHYDNVGNRTMANGINYAANNLNQYTDVNGVLFQYDDNGNLTDDGNHAYTYDDENRLTDAAFNSSNAGYAYDAFNRRVSKTVEGVTTQYYYDGDEVIAEYSSNGTLQKEFINGPNIDEPILMKKGARKYYYHYDGLGSVTALTDDTGQVVEQYTYDAYGQVSGERTVGNPYYFTGRRLDEETGIYYYRARMYDPTIGRFLQRDPIGYYDSMNLYQYVGNSPQNWVDPFGLCQEIISDGPFENMEEYMEYIMNQGVERGDDDFFIHEKVHDYLSDVPDFVIEYQYNNNWSDYVAHQGNHYLNYRLPGGYHLTVDKDRGGVWLHYDAHDPTGGMSQTFHHWFNEVRRKLPEVNVDRYPNR